MKKFALIGVAGYIAPRHIKAIKDVGGDLVASMDPHDSVGVLDSYFPGALYFNEFERFDRCIDKFRRGGQAVDFISICSPNYLHDSHIRFGLRSGADVICEKPLVLNHWNIDAIQDIERETGNRVNTILQLRLHPSVIALKRKIDRGPADKIYDVDLLYITSRGKWYLSTWKGENNKSGGIATNIGIHFFDLLHFVFGGLKDFQTHINEPHRAAGFLSLQRARVRWFLSIDGNDLPDEVKGQKPTHRSINVEGQELEFSGGFNDLHRLSYKAIVEGKGFGAESARASVATVASTRNASPSGLRGDYHPYLKKISA